MLGKGTVIENLATHLHLHTTREGTTYNLTWKIPHVEGRNHDHQLIISTIIRKDIL